MDLDLTDVSDLLNVTEETVTRWLQDGKIPSYRLNNECRFNRNEVENWVLTFHTESNEKQQHSNNGSVSFATELQEGKAKNPRGISQFNLYRAVNKGGIYKDVPGKSKEEVIKNAVLSIVQHLDLDATSLTELLLDREKLMPTALNEGIAMPHTRDFLLETHFDIVSVVYPKQPINYGALDKKPVTVLFFLFACDDRRHLQLLAKVAHFTSEQRNRKFLHTKPTREELLQNIREWENRF
ncbi:PTS sugar transporter subunit IIA [Simkania negevensis]|uniref:PTS sugar transporter subunit IIA n=1 Tax=Simkania negevensis TaxID=83561 RepID=A0ABS3APT7_9BACT|nr:PTS sugar transporter subunit IIA [Simkania negevensis]